MSARSTATRLSMPYSVQGYEARGEECAALAKLATDELIRSEILRLRQSYLTIAERLRQQGFEVGSRRFQ